MTDPLRPEYRRTLFSHLLSVIRSFHTAQHPQRRSLLLPHRQTSAWLHNEPLRNRYIWHIDGDLLVMAAFLLNNIDSLVDTFRLSNDHQSCITFFQESTGSRKTCHTEFVFCKRSCNIVLIVITDNCVDQFHIAPILSASYFQRLR